MPNRNWWGTVMRYLWLVALVLSELSPTWAADPPAAPAATAATTDEQRRSAAVALNYSRAALHRIRRNPSVRVMVEEQEKILNHLNLNGIADEEVMKLYSSVIDEVAQIQIADREREVLREKYRRAFNRNIGFSAFEIANQVATAQFASAVRTGANSWWDHRNQVVSKELDLWQVDKKRMTTVVDKSNQFLDTSWKMARAKQIPDRWLVRNDDLDKLEEAWNEKDTTVRLRVLKRMESFMECYPPYYYYVARTQQSMGQLFAATETYEKLATLGSGHFRKDEMLAAGLANRAFIQAFLGQPGAPETARKALEFSTDAWEANLICASVLEKYGRHQEAEDAILRNIDVNLERSQSRVALLGVYYHSDNRPELAARLTDPEWVKDISAAQLLLCAAKLAPAIPQPVSDQLQSSLQGTPRLVFGKDDFVLSASPTWQLHTATIALHIGDKTFTSPRVAAGRDAVLISFDGIAEFGGPLAPNQEDREIAVTIKYPDSAPVKLTLKARGGDARSSADGVGGASLAGRQHPVYRVSALEQNDVKLSLRSGPSADITDVLVPVSRSTAKPVLDQESPAQDAEAKTLTTPSVKVPGAAPAAR
jgi:tetratricopeptide (TPR) repeat protein